MALKKITPNNIDPESGLAIIPESRTQFSPDQGIRFGGKYGIGKTDHDEYASILSTELDPSYLSEFRAQSQSAPELIGKAIGQGLAEATIGSVESLGYLFDFEDLFNTEDMASRDFDNAFSKFFREAKEHVQEEWMPIYQSDVAKHGTFSQKLGDATWWASQGKTAGVTMSMMLPAMGVGAATAGVMRGLGAGAKAIQAGTSLMGGLSSAKIEAGMEASQAYKDMYERFMNDPKLIEEAASQYKIEYDQIIKEYDELSKTLYNPSDEDYGIKESQRQERLGELDYMINQVKEASAKNLDQMARERAGIGASNVYKANAIKAPLEIAQFAMLTTPFSKLKKGLDAAKKSKAAKIAGYGTVPASEALEEIYQGFAQQEAYESVKTGDKFFGEGALGRMAEFATTEEGKEAAFLGAAMGLLFQHAGKPIKKSIDAIKSTSKSSTKNLDLTPEDYALISNKQSASNILGDYKLSLEGKHDLNKTLDNINTSFDTALQREDLSDQDRELLEKQKEDAINNINYVIEQDNKLTGDPIYSDPKLRQKYVESKLMTKVYSDEVNKLSDMYNRELNNSGLESTEAELYSTDLQIKELSNVKKDINKDKSFTKEQKESLSSYIDSKVNKLKEQSASLEESLKTENKDFKKSKLTVRNKEELSKYANEKLNSEVILKAGLEPELNKFSNLSKQNATNVVENLNNEELKEEQKIYEVAINNATKEELDVIKVDLEQANPKLAETLLPKIEERKRILVNEESKQVNTQKLKNNAATFEKNIINKAVESNDVQKLAKAMNTLNKKDGVDLLEEDRVRLKNLVQSKIKEVRQAVKKEESAKIGDEVLINVGSKKGQVGKIVGQGKTGKRSFIVETNDGKKTYLTPDKFSKKTEEVEQPPLFDDEGTPTPETKDVGEKPMTEEEAIKAGFMFEGGAPKEDFEVTGTTEEFGSEEIDDIEVKKADIKGTLSGQGTSVELEIIGDSGKEFLITVDRKGNISLFSEKQSDGSYKTGEVAPKEAVDKLYNKYVSEKTKTAITNWLNAFTGSWAAPETQDGKNYTKAEEELNAELAALEQNELSKEDLEQSGVQKVSDEAKKAIENKEPIVEEEGIPENADKVTEDLKTAEAKVDGRENLSLYKKVENILLTTSAKLFKVIKINDKTYHKDEYDSNGKVILTDNYDASIADPNKFKPGEKVVAHINTGFIQKVKGEDHVVINGEDRGKLTALNLPINISSIEDFEAGNPAFMSIRDIGKGKDGKNLWPDMNEDAFAKTKELRNKVYSEYLKGNTQFYTTVLSKDTGWTNRTEDSMPVDKALKYNDEIGYGNKIEIAASDKDRLIHTKDGDIAINTKVPKGIPHFIITTANGDKVGISMQLAPVSKIKDIEGKQSEVEYKSFVDNVFSIIEAYVSGDSRLEQAGQVHDEVGKYFYLRKSSDDLRDKVNSVDPKLYNNAFALQRFGEDVHVFLPHKKGYKEVFFRKTKDGLEYYEYIQDPYGKAIKSKISREVIFNQFNKRLVEMYPNVKNMDADDMNNFERYENKDGKLELIKEHYLDFLGKSGVKTELHPVMGKDGNLYYVTQPNIEIDNNIETVEQNNKSEKESKESNETELNKVPNIEENIPDESSVEELPKDVVEETDIESITDEDGDFDELSEYDEYEESADLPIDYIDFNDSSLSSFSRMSSIQKETSMINSLLDIMLKKADKRLENKELTTTKELINETFKDLHNEYQKRLLFSENKPTKEDIKKYNVSANPKINKIIANNIKFILDNFNEVRDANGLVEFIGYKNRLRLEFNKLKFNSAYFKASIEEEEGLTESQRFIEGANYKSDPEKSTSAQIKRLVSNIPVRNKETGKIKINGIGLAETHDFGKVFNHLMENLTNIPIDGIMAELLDISANNMIAKDVYDKLNKLKEKNSDVYNKFLSVFKKQKAKFITLTFESKEVKGQTKKSTKAKVFEANRSGTKDIIFNKWKEKYESLNLDKSKIDSIFDNFTNTLRKGEVSDKQIIDIFKPLGINISEEAIAKLRKDFGNKNNKKYFKAEFGKSINEKTFPKFILAHYKGLFSDLYTGKDVFETQSGAIKSLAVWEQKFDTDASSQSFRNGNGDMIYSYVNPHHLSNIIDKVASLNADFISRKKEDPYSQYSTWLGDPNSVELTYFDSAKYNSKGSIAKEFQDQNDFEKEITKLSLFLNNNNKEYSYMFTASPSDKTTFGLLKILREQIANGTFKDGKLNLNKDLENKLFDLFVMSEINRINQTIADAKNIDKHKLLEGYHYSKKGLGSGALFFIIPELNTLPRKEDGTFDVNEGNLSDAKVIMNNFIENQIKEKFDQWSSMNIKDYIDSSSYSNRGGSLENVTADFVINNMVSYANQYMLFTGDPARFAKFREFNGKVSDYSTAIIETMPNMFKRIAKDIAPGIEGYWGDTKENKQYKVVFIEEPIANSLLAMEDGKINKKSPYAGIKLADAQEWTTLEEKVRVLKAYSRITDQQAQDILDNKDNLTWEQIGIVMQPDKPVQVYNDKSNSFHGEIDYYIKTSSFPLIPQLTKGFPNLEKMREFMEKEKIDRLVPQSAAKLGFHKSIKLFDGDKFNDNNGFVKEDIVTLNREGFRIQQDIPYDPNKLSILEGSQLRKVIFSDIETSEVFNLNGKKYSGNDLKKLSDKIHTQLYQNRYDELKNKLKVDKFGRITDVTELKQLMIEEGIDRDYSINDILMLGTLKMEDGTVMFKMPLFFHPMVHKIESLLTSVINNKLLKNKMPGKSFVQGSSLGFNVATEDFINSINKSTEGIILTEDYNGSLDYREHDGELFAEVMLPSTFMGIDPINDVDKDGFLDTKKIDPKLLEMIGYRIPTQPDSSIIRLKVVGILPEVAGDLIIVPPAMVTQMGSDFDVDKLYVHKRVGEVSDETNRAKYKKPSGKISDMNSSQLNNYLVDIYHSILANKSKQEASKTPLDNNDVQDVIDELGQDKPELISPISEKLQTKMIDIQAAGKIGIGITSSWVGWYPLQQYSGLYIKPVYDSVDKSTKYLSVAFSETNDKKNIAKFSDSNNLNEFKDEDGNAKYNPIDNTSNLNIEYGRHAYSGGFRMDKIYGFTGKKIMTVLKNIQTETVDNANNGRLYPMNLNKDTLNVAMLIGSVGYDERMIGYFLNQPIIKEYVRRINELDNYTDNEFVKNKKDIFKQEFLKEFGIDTPLNKLQTENVSLEDMKNDYKNQTLKSDNQKKVIQNFMVYDEITNDLRKIRKALNIDTKLLESSFASTVESVTSFNSNMKSKYIGNNWNLYEETTAGAAFDYGAQMASEMFGTNNIIPYNSKSIKSIIDEISKITGRDLYPKDIEEISIGIRSALWIETVKNKFDVKNIYSLKKSFLYGENNLGKEVIEAKEKYPDNDFIQSLIVTLPSKEEPVKIEHYSAKDPRSDYDYRKQVGWLKLLESKKDSDEYKLGLKLFFYSTLFGVERNAKDFGRFIPEKFIFRHGLDEDFRSIDFNDESNPAIAKLMDNFITQYFQNYPNKLMTIPEIKNNTKELLKENGELPKFAKEYNKNTRKMEVFVNSEGTYIKLDKLGTTFQSEFDIDLQYNRTVFNENSTGANIESVRTINKEGEFISDKNAGKLVMDSYDFNSGTEVVLQNIVKSNSMNAGLAEYLLNHINKVSSFSLEEYDVTNPDHYNPDKHIKYVKGRARLLDDGTGFILVNSATVSSEESFEKTFLHELLHAFTLATLNDNESNLTEEQLKSKKELEGVFNEIKKSATEEDLKKFSNALSNVKEFTVEAFTNVEFMQYLNNKKYENKNIIQKLIDIIKNMFTGVQSGSALEKTLVETLNIIETSEYTTGIEKTQDLPLDILNNDVTLTKTYSKVIESFDANKSKFDELGIKKEDLSKMSVTELGKFIKDNIC